MTPTTFLTSRLQRGLDTGRRGACESRDGCRVAGRSAVSPGAATGTPENTVTGCPNDPRRGGEWLQDAPNEPSPQLCAGPGSD